MITVMTAIMHSSLSGMCHNLSDKMSLYKDITLVELQKDDKFDKVLRQVSI
jgi:hypothetical protein